MVFRHIPIQPYLADFFAATFFATFFAGTLPAKTFPARETRISLGGWSTIGFGPEFEFFLGTKDPIHVAGVFGVDSANHDPVAALQDHLAQVQVLENWRMS
jgi:hypothetical protein